MKDEIKMIQREDGKFEEYDDAFDITLHFESEEEQMEALYMIERVLNGQKDFICKVKDNFDTMKETIKRCGGDPLAMESEIDLFRAYTKEILRIFLEWLGKEVGDE